MIKRINARLRKTYFLYLLNLIGIKRNTHKRRYDKIQFLRRKRKAYKQGLSYLAYDQWVKYLGSFTVENHWLVDNSKPHDAKKFITNRLA